MTPLAAMYCTMHMELMQQPNCAFATKLITDQQHETALFVLDYTEYLFCYEQSHYQRSGKVN